MRGQGGRIYGRRSFSSSFKKGGFLLKFSEEVDHVTIGTGKKSPSWRSEEKDAGEREWIRFWCFGDTGDWGLRYGNLRYLTNSKVMFGNSALIFPMDQEPVMFMFSGLQAGWAKKLSWIKDARFSPNLISDIVQSPENAQRETQEVGSGQSIITPPLVA